MENAKLDFWVGLFVATGLIALVVLGLKVGNLSAYSQNQGSYQLTANFENIGGLKSRAAVKSAGVVVGRVASIDFDNQAFQARVTLTIDKRYIFPKDTFASILTSGLLGENYIGLDAGGDPDNLKSGDKIAKTQSAVVLEQMISKFLYNSAQGTK